MLPLTFVNPDDYDAIDPRDRVSFLSFRLFLIITKKKSQISILGLKDFQEGTTLTILLTNPEAKKRKEIEVRFLILHFPVS